MERRENPGGVEAGTRSGLEAAREALEEYRSRGWDELLDGARRVVASHPLPAIAGAVVLGYGLGRLLGARR